MLAGATEGGPAPVSRSKFAMAASRASSDVGCLASLDEPGAPPEAGRGECHSVRLPQPTAAAKRSAPTPTCLG
eukprot:9863893-Alexandrium_andersonii.AAC.1